MTQALQAISPELYRWLREGKPYPAASRRTLRHYAWQQLFFRLNLRMQRLQSAGAGTAMHDPMFVLGLWRSGTTFAHELLSSVRGLAVPRTWQCMAPSTFLIAGRPKSTAIAKRPMDDFTIDAFTPQEDEFAALAIGLPSVYRGLLDPRRLGELKQWLVPDAWREPQAHEGDWLHFLEMVARVEGGGRLLLKSPSHSFRWPLLRRLFPNAPCVWVTRDPFSIFASNIAMWRAMTEVYGLASLPSDVLEDFLDAAFTAAAAALRHLCAVSPRSQFAVVGFDQLIHAPEPTIRTLVERLLPGTAIDNSLLVEASLRRASVRSGHHVFEPVSGRRAGILQELAQVQTAALASHGI